MSESIRHGIKQPLQNPSADTTSFTILKKIFFNFLKRRPESHTEKSAQPSIFKGCAKFASKLEIIVTLPSFVKGLRAISFLKFGTKFRRFSGSMHSIPPNTLTVRLLSFEVTIPKKSQQPLVFAGNFLSTFCILGMAFYSFMCYNRGIGGIYRCI